MAQRFGLATHVLRHWESMGLITPARVGGQRRYTDDDAYRVAAILRGKQAGLSLDQIQQMITTADPAPRTAILRRHRKELEDRIAATQAALDLINSVLGCHHADFTQCPRFREVITHESGAPGQSHDGPGGS
ncbi:MerR family transcriptional regulator [Micromonospora sp. URMC 103]|uniref:helix-turn-helix domain-containing protein n=1 Tax=Micromonospora sp. URMC 103 TaxID=3423406 RepID=UPI003F1C6503